MSMVCVWTTVSTGIDGAVSSVSGSSFSLMYIWDSTLSSSPIIISGALDKDTPLSSLLLEHGRTVFSTLSSSRIRRIGGDSSNCCFVSGAELAITCCHILHCDVTGKLTSDVGRPEVMAGCWEFVRWIAKRNWGDGEHRCGCNDNADPEMLIELVSNFKNFQWRIYLHICVDLTAFEAHSIVFDSCWSLNNYLPNVVVPVVLLGRTIDASHYVGLV